MVLIGVIVFVAVLSMLNVLAVGVRNNQQVHDMRLRVAKLQIRYACYLADLGDEDVGDGGFVVLNEELRVPSDGAAVPAPSKPDATSKAATK